jgi:hypothetical protein
VRSNSLGHCDAAKDSVWKILPKELTATAAITNKKVGSSVTAAGISGGTTAKEGDDWWLRLVLIRLLFVVSPCRKVIDVIFIIIVFVVVACST